MANKTKEELEKGIKALEDAGLDASNERAELRALAGSSASTKAAAKSNPEVDAFISLNVEAFKTGGGGWVAPATTGVKDAICTGYMVPSFVEDQVWFTFKNANEDEPFRGALICGALSKEPGAGGAWKVKEILDALNVQYEEDKARGGVKLLSSPEGVSCQVLWDDVVIKGKTERRIQDVMMVGAEAVM